MRKKSVIVQFIHKPGSKGSLVYGRCRNLQACLCVNINKLYLNITSCCVLPLVGLCFTNIKHESCLHQLSCSHFSLWTPECKFLKNVFEWEGQKSSNCVIFTLLWTHCYVLLQREINPQNGFSHLFHLQVLTE